MHIGTLLRRTRTWHGSRVAFVDAVGPWTFEAFLARAARFANALGGLGCVPGDRVALLLPDIREQLEADYGTMAAGCVSVPMAPGMRNADVAAHLRLTGARVLVTTADMAPLFDHMRSEVPSLDHIISTSGQGPGAQDYEALLALAGDQFPAPGAAGDLARLARSAGQTGQPKTVMLSHTAISATAGNIIAGFRITQDAIYLNVRPLWNTQQIMLLAYLLAGARVVLGGAFDPERFPFQMARFAATRSALSPRQLADLLPHLAPEDVALNAMEMLHLGGCPLPEAICDGALELMGPRLAVHYGLTEAPFSTMLAPERLAVKRALRQELRLTVGKPMFTCQTRLAGVADDMATGQEGELLIRGPHVMSGYWRDAEGTAQALQDGWLRTGDIASLSSQHDIRIMGRTRDMIRSSGQTISLREVEAAIARHPAIHEVAVVGLPDAEAGEAVTAFVVLKEQAAASAEEILAFSHGALIGAKRPKSIHLRSSLPRSDQGGIFLPDLLADLYPASGGPDGSGSSQIN